MGAMKRKIESASDGSDESDGGDEASLAAALGFLKLVAISHRDEIEVDSEWLDRVLVLREARRSAGHDDDFVYTKQNIARLCQFNCWRLQKTASPLFSFYHFTHSSHQLREKKQKAHKFLAVSIANKPTRRSTRTVLKLGGGSQMPAKRVPVDPTFQADVPDWTGPPDSQEDSDKNELTDSSRMDLKLWPVEGSLRNNDEGVVGKGRSISCDCTSPGSTSCASLHTKVARDKLMRELGPAFTSMGFNDMGEEVSKKWTQEEQMKFDDIVRQNPVSEGKCFLEPALKCFTLKSRKEIISFYYNVFYVRWMSLRTRSGFDKVDSDEEKIWGADRDSSDESL